MTTLPQTDWRDEVGVSGWKPPKFFRNADEVDAISPAPAQSHLLRRAFQRLELDGIVCLQNSPAIYFKEVAKADANEAEKLHRIFWNQGLAPVLVLIDPENVHVYSGLSLPLNNSGHPQDTNRLVEMLSRISQAAELRRLVLSIESGEYFRRHSPSFDPNMRVDRALLRNLAATRAALLKASEPNPNRKVLDDLLCRIVFVCYLFDRKVIGKEYLLQLEIKEANHLRDIFSLLHAKDYLYTLFKQLGKDFNGDLFIEDLEQEIDCVSDAHLQILSRFLRGTDAVSGQPSLWPYEFDIIPIETISAIYERFLKAEDPDLKKKTGAFYTPRFLAEVTLDIALDGLGSLLNKRFLDPSCGSGIFLVGLFNRIAEEWKRKHPSAGYARRATALIGVLRNNIFGLDLNPTACRIAAFSLYLALLDQLSPPAIQMLQKKGKVLPMLVCPEGQQHPCEDEGHTIRCGDFFVDDNGVADNFDLIIGNPPWASVTGELSSGEKWCSEKMLPVANRQLAIPFIWKAALHQSDGGRICFILPAMLLFNHHDTAILFQREWLQRHAIDVALNLADMRFNLFSEATGPAIVVRYSKSAPSKTHRIRYLAPKTSWSISQAEIVTILPEDRSEFRVIDAIEDTKSGIPPLGFKERFWGTPRDWKLLDRLRSLPSLSQLVGQTRDGNKRWKIAEGFKPELANGKTVNPVPRPWRFDSLFLDSRSQDAGLFVLESDCERIGNRFPSLHRKVTADIIFKAPHVLVWYGMRVAYADFDVLFRHAIRGIHGPNTDRSLLMFLTVYLNSPLARYFLFHTSANWGIERTQVHLEELLRVPFPLPENAHDSNLCKKIVEHVAVRFEKAIYARSRRNSRRELSLELQSELNPLVYSYFDIDENERVIIEDTVDMVIGSILPTRASSNIPTLSDSTPTLRQTYIQLLCDTLNEWASGGKYIVSGRAHVLPSSGIGAVVISRQLRTLPHTKHKLDNEEGDLVAVLDRLQKVFKDEMSAVEILRGIKVVDGNNLYVLKPLSRRFWTRTAALNDADEIAATILMQSRKDS